MRLPADPRVGRLRSRVTGDPRQMTAAPVDADRVSRRTEPGLQACSPADQSLRTV